MKKMIIGFSALLFISILKVNTPMAYSFSKNNYSVSENYCGDTAKAFILLELAKEYLVKNPKKAHDYVSEAMQLLNKTKCSAQQAEAYSIMGELSYYKRIYDEAEDYFNKALTLYLQEGKKSESVKALRSKGACYQATADYDGALRMYLMALDSAKVIQDESNIAVILFNIGTVYLKFNDTQKAKKYFSDALSNFKEPIQTEDLKALQFIYKGMGESFLVYGDDKKASEYFKEALKIAFLRGDSSAVCNIKTSIGKVVYFSNSIDLSRQDSALKIFKESLEQAIICGDSLAIIDNCYYIGCIFENQKLLDSAKVYLERALKIANNNEYYHNIFQIYNYLAYVYEEEGNYTKAYEFLRKADVCRLKVQNLNLVPAILSEYDAYQKEKEVLYEKIKSKEKNIVIIILFSVFLIFIISFFYYVKYTKSKHQLALYRIRLDTYVEAQDKERLRISEELHGSVAILLTAAKINLEMLSTSLDIDRIEEKIKEINKLIDDAFKKIRNLSHELMPGILKLLGLTAAIKSLIEKFKNKILIEFDYKNFESTRLPSQIEMGIYMVFQELFNNALRHSEANKLSIRIEKTANEFVLLMTDDGKGFEPEDFMNSKGNGWNNIQTRLQTINGHIEIHSSPNKGANIKVIVKN